MTSLTKEYFIQRTQHLKVAIVHDWMFSRRGGEKVLEQLLNLFPNSELFFLFGTPEKVLKLETKHKFYASFLNSIPQIEKIYKYLLPLFPIAVESFDLSNYNLIISSSSCAAKGVIPPPNAVHISYIHSPMRYAWDQEHRYFTKAPSFKRPFEILRRYFLNRLRIWDVTASVRIDKIIANSQFVARRCALYYGKNAEVIYPPIDNKTFYRKSLQIKDNLNKKVLLFGAWTPYKKMYEALKFLLSKGLNVVAAGHGEEIIKAKQEFSDRAEFFINPKDNEVPAIYSKSHVLLFPAIEDFGIVPLEATAMGLWVVAPNSGGTKETVINNSTGFTFNESSKESMLEAVKKALEKDVTENDFKIMQEHIKKYSVDIFLNNFIKQTYDTINSLSI